jgi:hypothetical protein
LYPREALIKSHGICCRQFGHFCPFLGKKRIWRGFLAALDSRRKRSGNIRVDLARANNAEKWPNSHSPSGCIESSLRESPSIFSSKIQGQNGPGAALDSQLQPSEGMRLRTRLARGPF